MLSEEQIKIEAKKRFNEMAPTRKALLVKEINEIIDMNEYVSEKGYLNLTREEQGEFHRLMSIKMNRESPGGVINTSLEEAVMKKLKCSREEIETMRKNPFVPQMLKMIVLAILPTLCIVVAAGIAKKTGVDLTIVYTVLSSLTGLFALGSGYQLVNCVKFRKIQKSYNKPEYQEERIKAAVYIQLREEIENKRNKVRV